MLSAWRLAHFERLTASDDPVLAAIAAKGGAAAVMEGDSIIGLIDRENIEEKLLVQRTLKERNKI